MLLFFRILICSCRLQTSPIRALSILINSFAFPNGFNSPQPTSTPLAQITIKSGRIDLKISGTDSFKTSDVVSLEQYNYFITIYYYKSYLLSLPVY